MLFKNLYTGTWWSARSALFADTTTKSPIQRLFHDALNTTRQYLRGVFKSKSLPSEVYRKQHRLPVEYFKENGQPRYTSHFRFLSYKPGSIYKVTSRWCTNSLTNAWRADLLRKFYRGGSGPLLCFVGFALAKKPSLLTEKEELEGVSFLIRESFSSLPLNHQCINIDKSGVISNSITLVDLKIGELIAKGCNAAIYSASTSDKYEDGVKENTKLTENIKTVKHLPTPDYVTHFQNDQDHGLLGDTRTLKEIGRNPEISVQNKFFMPHLEGQDNQSDSDQKDVSFENASFGDYNMAVKVMFNYSAESNAYAIWNAMYRETLPLFGEFSVGDAWKTKIRKKLKPHPNIVKMFSAFADQLPLLPGAMKNFPLALPPRLLDDGCGRNMTLFLVMKRYHCCLKDYLRSQDIRPETSLLLFTQLLEALVHLFQNGVVHRDLKTDNILLDLSLGIASPRLAIGDFGCCLENLTLPYTSYDINKGGNMSLMAPEVVNCEPGPFSTIDYTRSDLWAAGAIAYEIFGGTNPFYSNLKSNTYKAEDLPPFQSSAPLAVKKLVKKMLHVNPSQRPSQNFAATVCQLLLHAPPSLLFSTFDAEVHKKALKWMFQLSTTTYLEVLNAKPEEIGVKLELKTTFCSRIQYLEVIEALKFILDP